MWQIDKSQCVSNPSAKPEEIIPPICTKWWHRPAIIWMEWSVPAWFNWIMTWILGRTWRGYFPNFILQHFLYTGEWEIYFTMWGHPYGIIYGQRFAKAQASGIPAEYLPSEDAYCPRDE